MNKPLKIMAFAVLTTMAFSMQGCFWDDFDAFCDNANGEFTSRTYELSEIEGLNLAISANVFLSEGDVQEVRIEGKRDAIEKLDMDLNNKILHIDFDECVSNHDLNIYLTVQKLTSVSVSGSGDVIGETAFNQPNENLVLQVTGSGYAALETNYQSIESRITGSGDIRLSGHTDTHNCRITGSGNLKGFDLKSVDYDITISGSGDGEIYVDGGALDAQITGSGEVRYKGDPSSINLNVSGSGKVINAN